MTVDRQNHSFNSSKNRNTYDVDGKQGNVSCFSIKFDLIALFQIIAAKSIFVFTVFLKL